MLALRDGGRGPAVVSVGRRVCQWRNGGGRARGYYVHATALFARDGMHLAPAGYGRLAPRMPAWLRVGAR